MGRFASTVWLEVERKFAALKSHPLRVDSGNPPFLNLTDLGYRRFYDAYYDLNGQLWKGGTWLSQRDGKWQMKIRRGGTYVNSQSEEVSDLDIISAQIKSLTGCGYGPSQLFGLSHFAGFQHIPSRLDSRHGVQDSAGPDRLRAHRWRDRARGSSAGA